MTGASVTEPHSTDTALRRRVTRTLLPGFLGTTLPGWMEERLRNGLGGVCLFGQNIVARDQLRELTDAIYAANPDAIIAIDEEGGDVTRLYYATGSPQPGNAVLGRLDDTVYTESLARRIGHELRAVGVNLDFAPDVDINSNPDNPVIGTRSFGSTPELVAQHGAAWIRGLQSVGVAACAKHFPGHGDTGQDSHLALPVVDVPASQLREREFAPFRAAVDAGVRVVMTSHILLPQLDAVLPATFSRTILQGVLRDELGFDGVIVTDALDMHGASGERGIPEAAALALAAGCDLLCIGTENTDEQLAAIEDAVVAAVESGRIPRARIDEAADRVLGLAADLRAESSEMPFGSDPEPGVIADSDRERALLAVEVSPAAREWLGRHRGRYSVVRVETVANIAVGEAPWGPFAEVAAEPEAPAAVAFAANPAVVFTEGDHPDLVLAAQSPVLVIGKDNHRHPATRAAIDRLRAERDSVLVVDMGWPGTDRDYADIATFGASRLLGRALLDLLAGELPAGRES